MDQREQLGIDLRGRNIQGLLARQGRTGHQPRRDGHILHDPDDHRALVHVTSDGILAVEDLAHECPVHDGHVLSIRAICFREGAPDEDPDLQRLEITGSDVYLVRFDVLSCFSAVADGQRSVDRSALIRQAQADGGVLHAGNLPHGGNAFVQQLHESRRIVETGIVERGLAGRYSVGIEAGRQRLQVDQGADDQAGGGQQHDRESDLAGDKPLAQAQAAASGHGADAHRRA